MFSYAVSLLTLYRIDQSFCHAQLIPLVAIVSLTLTYSYRVSNRNLKREYPFNAIYNYEIYLIKASLFVAFGAQDWHLRHIHDMTRLPSLIEISERYRKDILNFCRSLLEMLLKYFSILCIIWLVQTHEFNRQENTIILWKSQSSCRNISFAFARLIVFH